MRHIALACLFATALSLGGVTPLHAQSTVSEVMAPAPAAPPARAMTAEDATRMVGEWEEYSPGRNFVDFLADGRVMLHLKPGDVGNLEAMEGRWSRDDDGLLVLDFQVLGQSLVQRVGVDWDGEELLLIDARGMPTRHRRRTGPLPADYRH